MKKYVMIIFVLFYSFSAVAQSQEAQQLLLNVEKLAQLKKVLNNMYQGYETVSKGYSTITNISKGNFSLHELFLDGLMQVSPTVKKYKRVVDIIGYQTQLVKEYKTAFASFKKSNLFNLTEVGYMGNVYNNIFFKSLQNLDELAMLITAGKLRMNDEERIAAIDRIFNGMGDKLTFLRGFNRGNSLLALQRAREINEVILSKKLNGIP